jgi:hypothetical protein
MVFVGAYGIRPFSISNQGRIDKKTSHLTKAASCQVIGYAIRPYVMVIVILNDKRNGIKNYGLMNKFCRL